MIAPIRLDLQTPVPKPTSALLTGAAFMTKIVFIGRDGARHELDAESGSTVMETAIKAGVPGIEAASATRVNGVRTKMPSMDPSLVERLVCSPSSLTVRDLPRFQCPVWTRLLPCRAGREWASANHRG